MKEIFHITNSLPFGRYTVFSSLIVESVIKRLLQFHLDKRIDQLIFERRPRFDGVSMFLGKHSLLIFIGTRLYIGSEQSLIHAVNHALAHVIVQVKRGINLDTHDIFFYTIGNKITPNFEINDRKLLGNRLPSTKVRQRLELIEGLLVEKAYYKLLSTRKIKDAHLLKRKIIREVQIREERVDHRLKAIPNMPKLVLYKGFERRVIMGSTETVSYADCIYPLKKRQFSTYLQKHGTKYLQTLKKLWHLLKASVLDIEQINHLDKLRIKQYRDLKKRFAALHVHGK